MRFQSNFACRQYSLGTSKYITVKSQVLTCVTNKKINFLSKGHSTLGSKIPFISNFERPAYASKQDMLEFATLWDGDISWTVTSLGHYFSKWATFHGHSQRVTSRGHYFSKWVTSRGQF